MNDLKTEEEAVEFYCHMLKIHYETRARLEQSQIRYVHDRLVELFGIDALVRITNVAWKRFLETTQHD